MKEKSILSKFTGWDLVKYWQPHETEFIGFYDKNGNEVIAVSLEELIAWYLNLDSFYDFIELALKKAKG